MLKVRLTLKEDLLGLIEVLDAIDLFPSEMLYEMIDDYFTNLSSTDLWFSGIENDEVVALGYCAKEKLTVGTYNLYALGINPKYQGKGIGRAMISCIEQKLIEIKARILIVDTSGTDDYESSRKFYEKLKFTKEAVIRDFWDKGDDKVIFWKRLD